MQESIFISPKDLIINEGVSKAGKVFKMIALDRNLVNSDTFIEMARAKGAKVFKHNNPLIAQVTTNKSVPVAQTEIKKEVAPAVTN